MSTLHCLCKELLEIRALRSNSAASGSAVSRIVAQVSRWAEMRVDVRTYLIYVFVFSVAVRAINVDVYAFQLRVVVSTIGRPFRGVVSLAVPTQYVMPSR